MLQLKDLGRKVGTIRWRTSLIVLLVVLTACLFLVWMLGVDNPHKRDHVNFEAILRANVIAWAIEDTYGRPSHDSLDIMCDDPRFAERLSEHSRYSIDQIRSKNVVDPWGNKYKVRAAGSWWTVYSVGPNGVDEMGLGDDLEQKWTGIERPGTGGNGKGK